MFDLILKNGVVLDGTGKQRFRADVGVTRGLITAVGDLKGRRAHRVEDVSGLFVIPGFIDLLNHSDGYLTLFARSEAENMLRQGVTTVIGGNCGTSLAPLASRKAARLKRTVFSFFQQDVRMTPSIAYEHFLGVRKWSNVDGVNIDWVTMKEFLAAVRAQSLGVSFGSFVGFGTLRRGVVGDDSRPSSEKEVTLMEHELREALRDGALGLSFGLNFTHEIDESFETLVALARVAQEEGKSVSFHLRSEREQLLESVEEVLRVVRETGVSATISHIKAIGAQAEAVFPRVLERITDAHKEGLDVNMTVYPYGVSYSVLAQFLPSWIKEGGREALLKRLSDVSVRQHVIDEIEQQREHFAQLIIARVGHSQEMLVNKTFQEIARIHETSVAEAVVRVLQVNDGFVMCFDPSVSIQRMEEALAHPLSLVVTEGAFYSETDAYHSGYITHPRSFGAYARFFGRFVQERGLLSWEEGVQKCASLPALKLGLRDRGFIARGLRADVLVLDPEEFIDRATLRNPYQYAKGIRHVLVHGEFAIDDGVLSVSRSGGIIRI